MSDWTAAWASSPTDTDIAGNGDEAIADTRTTIGVRLAKEHLLDYAEASPQPKQGRHRPGSAVAYAQAAAPTLKPDGSAALDADDAGRLWIDTDDNRLRYWKWTSGTGAWTDVIVLKSFQVIYVGATAPIDPVPSEGTLWWDTANSALKAYTSAAWLTISSKIALAAPASPVDGDIWVL